MNEVVNFLEQYFNDLFDHIAIKPQIDIKEEEEVYTVDITGDNLNFLIGYHGSSLDGLQHVISLTVYNHFEEWKNIVVDVNGYRGKKKRLEDIAKSYIDRVRFFNEEVDMPPMKAFDRKQIHEFVSSYSDVISESEGEGFDRHIVLRPAN